MQSAKSRSRTFSCGTVLLRLTFAGHLDLSRVGVFGHSAGGQAAAHACQIDRLRACLNQDGLSGFAPYYLDASGWGMDQAFMLIIRAPRTDPPDESDGRVPTARRLQAGSHVFKRI